MVTIQSGERIFEAKKPVKIETQKGRITTYKNASEIVLIEEDLLPSGVFRVKKKNPQIGGKWEREFFEKEGAKLEEVLRPWPGVNIRHPDSYNKEVMPKVISEEEKWGRYDKKFCQVMISPYMFGMGIECMIEIRDYHAFMSRAYHPVHPSLFDNTEHAITRACREALREIIVGKELVYEVITPNGLILIEPNTDVLKEVFAKNVVVGMSYHQGTLDTVCEKVFERLCQDETPEVQKMLEKSNASGVGMNAFAKTVVTIGGDRLEKMADSFYKMMKIMRKMKFDSSK